MKFKDILKRLAKMDGGEKIRIALEKTELVREVYAEGQKARANGALVKYL